MQNNRISRKKFIGCATYGTDRETDWCVYGKVIEFTIKYYYSSVEKAILTFGIW